VLYESLMLHLVVLILSLEFDYSPPEKHVLGQAKVVDGFLRARRLNVHHEFQILYLVDDLLYL
jgi:hypothetical protein